MMALELLYVLTAFGTDLIDFGLFSSNGDLTCNFMARVKAN